MENGLLPQILKLFGKRSFVFFIFCLGQTGYTQSAQEIVETLSRSEMNHEKRLELIQKLDQYPSNATLEFLNELIELEPTLELQRVAYLSSKKVRRFLAEEDPVIFSFKDKHHVMRLTKTEVEEKAAQEPWNGDIQAFLRQVVFDHLLDIEMDQLNGMKVEDASILTGRNMYLPTRASINEAVDSEIRVKYADADKKQPLLQNLLRSYPLSEAIVLYYSKKRVNEYLWKKFVEQLKEQRLSAARAEIFLYLIEQNLRTKGKSRGDFGPEFLRNRHAQLKNEYEEFRKNSPNSSLKEWVSNKPEFQFLIEGQAVNRQEILFQFPSIEEYRKRDPLHAQEAQLEVKGLFDAILSSELIGIIQQECMSAFDLDLGEKTSETHAPKTYVDQLQARLDEQIKNLAIQVKNGIDTQKAILTKEKLLEVLSFFFEALKKNIESENSTLLSPTLVLINAIGETKALYYVSNREALEACSKEYVSILFSFLDLCGDILLIHLKDLVFDHLEGRKVQFENVYHKVQSKLANPTDEENRQVFENVAKEFQKQWPAEFNFIDPHWVEVEKGETLPHGLENHYEWGDLHPSLRVFQWMDFRPERVLSFSEQVQGVQIYRWIQNDLVYQAFQSESSIVGRSLIKKYQGYIETLNYPERLLTEQTILEEFQDFNSHLMRN